MTVVFDGPHSLILRPPALVDDAMLATTEKHQDGLEFYQRLIEGDELACRKLVRRLQVTEGASVVRICEALTEAFHAIGDTWQCSQLEIYREHIASEIAYAMLLELWARLPEPESDAPLAVGCTPEDDPYRLPTLMVEVVLRELGWRTQSFGTNLPLEMLEPAFREVQPGLCWVSVSQVASETRLQEQLAALSQLAQTYQVEVVCGGRGVRSELVDRYAGIRFVRDLSGLAIFEPDVSKTRHKR